MIALSGGHVEVSVRSSRVTASAVACAARLPLPHIQSSLTEQPWLAGSSRAGLREPVISRFFEPAFFQHSNMKTSSSDYRLRLDLASAYRICAALNLHEGV
jgi:hypothetical protein